jgi:hypothetical protein
MPIADQEGGMVPVRPTLLSRSRMCRLARADQEEGRGPERLLEMSWSPTMLERADQEGGSVPVRLFEPS